MNGLSIAVFGTRDSSGAGLTIGGFTAGGPAFNGGAFSGVYSHARNGLSVGGVASTLRHGLSIGPSYAEARSGVAVGMIASVHSGLAIGGSVGGDTVSGVALALGWIVGNSAHRDTLLPSGNMPNPLAYQSTLHLNGLIVAGMWIMAGKTAGVATAPVVLTNRLHGVSIGVFNHTNEAHGIQLGLLNYMGNNRRWCRWLPIVNIHLSKKSIVTSTD